MTAGGNLGDLRFRLGADTQEAHQNITKLQGHLHQLSVTARTAFAFGAGVVVAQQAITQLSSTVAGMGAAFTKSNAVLERQTATFEAFTKSAARSQEIIQALRERADISPFGTAETIESGKALISVARGSKEALLELVSVAEQLGAEDPIQGLRGAAYAIREAMSGDFQSLIERFEMSRVTIQRLKDEGLPNLEIIKRALAEKGVGPELVERLGRSFQGRMSTVMSFFDELKRRVGEGVFERLSAQLGNFVEWITKSGPAVKEFASAVGNILGGMYTAVSQKLSGVKDLFKPLIDGFRGFANMLTVGNISGALDELEAGISQQLNKVIEVIKSFASGFASAGESLIGGLIKGFQGAWEGFVSGAIALVSGATSSLLGEGFKPIEAKPQESTGTDAAAIIVSEWNDARPEFNKAGVDAGKEIGNGLQAGAKGSGKAALEGIKKEIGDLKDAMRGVDREINAVEHALRPVDDALTAIRRQTEDLKQGFEDQARPIREALQAITERTDYSREEQQIQNQLQAIFLQQAESIALGSSELRNRLSLGLAELNAQTELIGLKNRLADIDDRLSKPIGFQPWWELEMEAMQDLERQRQLFSGKSELEQRMEEMDIEEAERRFREREQDLEKSRRKGQRQDREQESNEPSAAERLMGSLRERQSVIGFYTQFLEMRKRARRGELRPGEVQQFKITMQMFRLERQIQKEREAKEQKRLQDRRQEMAEARKDREESYKSGVQQLARDKERHAMQAALRAEQKKEEQTRRDEAIRRYELEQVAREEQRKEAAKQQERQRELDLIERERLGIQIRLLEMVDRSALAQVKQAQAALSEQERTLSIAQQVEDLQKKIRALPLEQQLREISRAQEEALRPLEEQARYLTRQREDLQQIQQGWQRVKQDMGAAMSELQARQEDLREAAEAADKAARASQGSFGSRTPEEDKRLEDLKKRWELAGNEAGVKFAEGVQRKIKTLLTDNAGGLIGGLAGGAIGAAFGPIGSLIGGFLGEAIGQGIQKDLMTDERGMRLFEGVKKAATIVVQDLTILWKGLMQVLSGGPPTESFTWVDTITKALVWIRDEGIPVVVKFATNMMDSWGRLGPSITPPFERLFTILWDLFKWITDHTDAILLFGAAFAGWKVISLVLGPLSLLVGILTALGFVFLGSAALPLKIAMLGLAFTGGGGLIGAVSAVTLALGEGRGLIGVLSTLAQVFTGPIGAIGRLVYALTTAGGLLPKLAELSALLIPGGPIGIAIAGLSVLIGALAVAWISDFGGMRAKTAEFVKWFQENVSTPVGTELNKVRDKLKGWGKEIDEAFAETSTDEKKSANIKDAFLRATGLGDLRKSIREIMDAIPEDIKEDIGKIVAKIGEGSPDAVGALKKMASDMVAGAKAEWEQIPGEFESAWNTLKEKFNGFFEGLGPDWAAGWARLKEAANKALADMKADWEGWVNGVTNWWNGIWTNWIEPIRKLGQDLNTEGNNAINSMVSGFIQGLNTYGNNATEAIWNWVRGWLRGIKDILGIESPSTVFADIALACTAGFLEGLFNSAKEFFDAIVKWVDDWILGPIRRALGIEREGSPSSVAENYGAGIITGFIDGIRSNLSSLKSWGEQIAYSVFSGIKDWINQHWKTVQTWWDLIAKPVQSAASSIQDTVDNVVNTAQRQPSRMQTAERQGSYRMDQAQARGETSGSWDPEAQQTYDTRWGDEYTGRAFGGPVSANTMYTVGERGKPEVFETSTPGTITPMEDMNLGGRWTIDVSGTVRVDGMPDGVSDVAAMQITEAVVSAITERRRIVGKGARSTLPGRM